MAAASYRFAGQPRWLVGHALVIAAVVGMILLGRWQLSVSERKHFNIQNFGYALQWWAFSGFAVVFWVKILRDRVRGQHDGVGMTQAPAPAGPAPAPAAPVPGEVAYRRYVMPTRNGRDDDPERTRYNAYLATFETSERPDDPGRSAR